MFEDDLTRVKLQELMIFTPRRSSVVVGIKLSEVGLSVIHKFLMAEGQLLDPQTSTPYSKICVSTIDLFHRLTIKKA
jgi:hypothetical protein